MNSFTDRMIASVQEARIALETLFVRDAIEAWLEEARTLGREIPAPSRHLATTQA